MKFIGITGGVGAGKSAILDFIREHYRAKVVLADDLAKELMEPGTACHKKLLEAFGGDGVFDETGVMGPGKRWRPFLFTKPKKRRRRRHRPPAVKEEILRQVAEEREKGELSYFFLEAALLIEEHYDASATSCGIFIRVKKKDGSGWSKIGAIPRSGSSA